MPGFSPPFQVPNAARRDYAPNAMESPAPGGTRGGAKDAPERVKAQAVILYYKKRLAGAARMAAYDFAARLTANSTRSVSGWVKLENELGMDGLESRRDNCGPVTAYSPSKKVKIDALMEDTEQEPTLRDVQAALDLGSPMTAQLYLAQAGWTVAVKRLKTLLSPAHMRARVEYVEKHFEDDFQTTFMSDEKLFVMGLGKKTRYVRREASDQPCYKFIDNTLHPEQLMVVAVVGRPDPAKGFDGKVWIDWCCAEWKQAVKDSKNRKAGTWEIKPTTKEDGSFKGVSGEAYKALLLEYGFPHIQQAREMLEVAEVIFQDDNAPAHSNAWGKLKLGEIAAKHGIKRGDQPARSPDLNVLDLYVWRVLEAGVHKRRPKTLTELWTAIKAAWDEDLTEDKLECAYRLLTPVMGLIGDKNGGNNFTLPHTGIRKAMREDGWEI